ncbi:hypothetical protein [Stenotrophomonas sp. G106K1]|uniref:hypothetical protein n=1 Tax=Stenotrophomonas sp. G106K1 TaxID=3134792 RepID=UPI0030F36F5C
MDNHGSPIITHAWLATRRMPAILKMAGHVSAPPPAPAASPDTSRRVHQSITGAYPQKLTPKMEQSNSPQDKFQDP